MPTRDDAITTHAANKYLPEPKVRRDGIGLCLSGGGYRAALFHLGALKRLNEFGILAKLRTISSVSGGSISSGLSAMAGHPDIPQFKNPANVRNLGLGGLSFIKVRTPGTLAVKPMYTQVVSESRGDTLRRV